MIELLSATEVATLLGCHESTVWVMLRAGEIPPPIKIRSNTRWRKAEVLAWLDAAPPGGAPPLASEWVYRPDRKGGTR